jgi:nitrate reductase NapE component
MGKDDPKPVDSSAPVSHHILEQAATRTLQGGIRLFYTILIWCVVAAAFVGIIRMITWR